MPLSVLEAMACNLPVITTRFGCLTDYFEEDDGFSYVDSVEDLVDAVKLIRKADRRYIHNDKKVMQFSWSRFADEVITACGESA